MKNSTGVAGADKSIIAASPLCMLPVEVGELADGGLLTSHQKVPELGDGNRLALFPAIDDSEENGEENEPTLNKELLYNIARSIY